MKLIKFVLKTLFKPNMNIANKKTIHYIFFMVASGILIGPVYSAFGTQVNWADWISANTGNSGTAAGTVVLPDSRVISVNYSGEILFAQTSGGTNYWSPSTPYVSTTVDNPPPASDIIALVGGNVTVNVINFTEPVENPIMAIATLGSPSIPSTYQFNAPFTILSSGPGYWGDGTLTQLPGNVLEGVEGHGVIQFTGSYTSISWTVPEAESWHGFTVGISSSASQPISPVAGWYSNNEPSLIYEDSLGLKIVWQNSYVYPYQEEAPLFWYAEILYFNNGSQNLSISCSGRTDPSLAKEHIRGSINAGSFAAEETFCSRNPIFAGLIAPGGAHYEWAIFRNVTLSNDSEVSLEWAPYGSSVWVSHWQFPISAPPPAVCPEELVTIGTCQQINVCTWPLTPEDRAPGNWWDDHNKLLFAHEATEDLTQLFLNGKLVISYSDENFHILGTANINTWWIGVQSKNQWGLSTVWSWFNPDFTSYHWLALWDC